MASPEMDHAEVVERARVGAAEVSWSLRAVARATADLDQAVAKHLGLRPLDFAAVGHLMSSGEDLLGPAELGHRLGISTGSATELVDRLERAGHLDRRREASDRRRVSLHLRSESTMRIIGELRPLLDSLDELAADFTEPEQDVIERYLRQATGRVLTHAAALRSGPGASPS